MVKPTSIQVSKDGLSVDISLPSLKQGYIYQFETDKLRNTNGQQLASSLFCYNLIEIFKK
jgi:hypothetical protein